MNDVVSPASMPMRQPDFGSGRSAGRAASQIKSVRGDPALGETAACSYEETVEVGGKVAEVKANPLPYWEVAD